MSYDPNDFQGRSEKQYKFSAITVLLSMVGMWAVIIWLMLS